MMDPTGQLYVVSKTKARGGRLAKLPSSAWGGDRYAASFQNFSFTLFMSFKFVKEC